MSKVQVFDPAMCCSTGVCGPGVDPVLARFASDLAWLAAQGIPVQRFNLGQQPEQFASHPQVLAELQQDAEVLPLIMVDGEIVSRREYPTRRQLAGWAGLEAPGAGLPLPLLGA
jgi:hypothetical protein